MREEPEQPAQTGEPTLPNPSPARGEGLRIRPNKNRLLQRSAPPNRKLFDAAAKRRFLDVFAATASATMGAKAAGVAYQTVFKHRARDAEFAAAWEDALAQGYARLEAEVLAAALSPAPLWDEGEEGKDRRGGAAWAHSARAEAPACAGELEGAGEQEVMTVEQKLAILREYRRGFGAGRRAPSARPVVASQEEAIAALAKRLANFAVKGSFRSRGEDLALPAPEGPSTGSGQGGGDGGAGDGGEGAGDVGAL